MVPNGPKWSTKIYSIGWPLNPGLLGLVIIFLVITLYLHINASDCRGQIITKSKTSKGEIYSREAKLSIHDGHGLTESQPLK